MNNNEDKSVEIIERWLEKILPLNQYHEIIKVHKLFVFYEIEFDFTYLTEAAETMKL